MGGKMGIDNRDTQIHELLHSARELYLYSADIKDIAVDVNIDSSVPSALITDAGKVSQVVNNLLSNAIKFTDEGTITIGAEYRDNHLIIAISDTGIGISEDKLNTIFEKFESSALRGLVGFIFAKGNLWVC